MIHGEEQFTWKQGTTKWCYTCRRCGKKTSTTIWGRAKVAECSKCTPSLIGLLKTEEGSKEDLKE